jgi:hypothetical protein
MTSATQRSNNPLEPIAVLRLSFALGTPARMAVAIFVLSAVLISVLFYASTV